MWRPGVSDTEDTADPVHRVRAAVAAALRDQTGGPGPLVRVCRACAELLPVDGASISVMTGTQDRETLYASDEVVDRIEALQSSLGEGPGFEAFATHRPVLVPDLARASGAAWPIFASQTVDVPVAAIFAFPLQTGAIGLGTMDMYRRKAGWLSPDELTTALQVVDIATAALLGLQADSPAGGMDDAWLAGLRRDREEVHQATGMLIARFGIPAEHALARLRGYAFAAERLVDEVARDIVTRQLDLDDIET